MANVKISQLPAVTVPLAGTEELPVVQGGVTKRTAINNILNANTIPYIANGLGAVATPSYTFTGDLNTGMWSPAADTIAFSEGGVEAMRIDSSGNVGIGTASPGAKLEVNGGANFQGTGVNTNFVTIGIARITAAVVETGLLLYTRVGGADPESGVTEDVSFLRSPGVNGNLDLVNKGTGSIAITAEGAGAVVTRTSNTERMRITSAGNVGIGTSSPTSLLDVNGNAEIAGTLFLGASNHGNLGSDATQLFARGNNIAFQNAAGSTTYAYINSSGNVGIGTASPTAKLDVIGNANFGAAILTGSGVSTGDVQLELGANRSGNGLAYVDLHSAAGGDFQTRIIRYAGANGGMDIIQTGTGGMVITNEGSADTAFKTNALERMRITNAGNVGIGTASPSTKLHVAGALTLDTALSVANGGTGLTSTPANGALDIGNGTGFTRSTLTAGSGVSITNGAGTVTISATGSGGGTVTSVSGTGSTNGLSLSGTVTSAGNITLSGSVTSVATTATIDGVTIGYRSIPRSTTTTTAVVADVGKCIAVTAGITIPNSTFAAGDALSIYNDSASAITITAGVTTLRQAGTANTGNRTLAARGMATVWFNSATEAVISGAGVS
jgi:hypothetical protein